MRRPGLRWAAVLLPLTLVAAACAGDDDADDDAAGEETTSTADEGGDEGGADSEFEPLVADAAEQCGTEEYAGNLATIEAVDETTVRFSLCEPDVAFPAKVAFSAFGIHPSEHLAETGGAPIDDPIGTGPYRLEAWERGSQVVLTRNDDYWGEAPAFETAVFRFSTEAAQRLVELQSGTAQGIDNVGPEDFETVSGDSNLQLVERDPLNVFYVGMNVDIAPFDNEALRQAIGFAIDKQRLVDGFYPPGSQAASGFLPPGIPGFPEDFEGFTYDPEQVRALLAEAGFPDGLDVTLAYRDTSRGYLPQPTQVATDIQAQLAEVGIRVTLELQESTQFIDNVNAGVPSLYLLGWGADYPDPTNFLDYHFGGGAPPQFGTGFPEVFDVLAEAGSTTDAAERADLYAEAEQLIFERAPMIPVAYGGSAVAYQADIEGAHASPLSNEQFAALSGGDAGQFTFVQNGEPGGLYCADETDGESLRVCEQINEALLGYEVGGTEVIEGLAEAYEANEDLTEWTFTLREGVTFHDGTALDANDVVESYRVQWDAADPLHTGREGVFSYFQALFGGFLNAPPEEEG